MDPFWAWIYVEPKSGLENNITEVKQMKFIFILRIAACDAQAYV